jgi:hypothetical protein
MNREQELKPCPFCGGTSLKSGGDDKHVGYWCLDCGAAGPNHYNSRFDWNTRAALEPAPMVAEEEVEQIQCERCQGNGEIVKDWDRYRRPHEGDIGDEAVAECPDCSGERHTTPVPAPKVTAPELLERLAAAQEPLDAEFAKALFDNREALYATDEDAKTTAETDLISALGENYWDLRCFSLPTGQGDADVGWRVIEHHMAKPHERVVAEVYIDDPAAAVRAALEAAKGGEG